MATKAEKIATLKRAIRALASFRLGWFEISDGDLRNLEELITDLGGDARNIPGSPKKGENDDEDFYGPVG